jgi:hypothetical protein
VSPLKVHILRFNREVDRYYGGEPFWVTVMKTGPFQEEDQKRNGRLLRQRPFETLARLPRYGLVRSEI